jgi:hypothetical protein
MRTCDDQAVPKPATGKTPVRNARIPDEVWLPGLARAEMEGRSASEALTEAFRDYGYGDAAPSYDFTIANWPDAAEWARGHRAALGSLIQELEAALGPVPVEWLSVAAWLASTHHTDDRAQQKRVITGHILRRFDSEPVRSRYRDSRHLSETVQAILAAHLPLAADG